jgi:ATP-dependent 26S proteasome regulatory subunit
MGPAARIEPGPKSFWGLNWLQNQDMTTIEPVITGIKIDYFVKQTNGWSAAELKTLVNEARIHATTNNSTFISDYDFKAALRIVKMGRRNP